MRSVLWIAAGVLLAVCATWFFFLRAPAITNYPSSGRDIVAMGDSLVSGTGATEGRDFVSLLSAHIGERIVNLGNPGDKTADVLARMGELDKYRPKVVILLAGGNDYLRNVPDQEVFINLGKIIEDIHRRGSIVLLVGIRGGVLADPYAARFKELARTHNVAYVPNALEGLLGNREYMADSVHPNDAGYALLAGRLAPVLRNLLQ